MKKFLKCILYGFLICCFLMPIVGCGSDNDDSANATEIMKKTSSVINDSNNNFVSQYNGETPESKDGIVASAYSLSSTVNENDFDFEQIRAHSGTIDWFFSEVMFQFSLIEYTVYLEKENAFDIKYDVQQTVYDTAKFHIAINFYMTKSDNKIIMDYYNQFLSKTDGTKLDDKFCHTELEFDNNNNPTKLSFVYAENFYQSIGYGIFSKYQTITYDFLNSTITGSFFQSKYDQIFDFDDFSTADKTWLESNLNFFTYMKVDMKQPSKSLFTYCSLSNGTLTENTWNLIVHAHSEFNFFNQIEFVDQFNDELVNFEESKGNQVCNYAQDNYKFTIDDDGKCSYSKRTSIDYTK